LESFFFVDQNEEAEQKEEGSTLRDVDMKERDVDMKKEKRRRGGGGAASLTFLLKALDAVSRHILDPGVVHAPNRELNAVLSTALRQLSKTLHVVVNTLEEALFKSQTF